MRSSPIVLLLFAMLGFDSAARTLMPPANAADLVESQEQEAIAAIKKWGGKVTIDEKSPNKTVIGVDLRGTNITDEGMIELLGLNKLQSLNLGNTMVTDEGVKKLEIAIPDCKFSLKNFH